MKRMMILILPTIYLIPISFALAGPTVNYNPTNSNYCGWLSCPYAKGNFGESISISFDVDGYENREILSKTLYVNTHIGGCDLIGSSGLYHSVTLDGGLDTVQHIDDGCGKSGDTRFGITAWGTGVYQAESRVYCSPSPYLKVSYGDFCSAPKNLTAYAGTNSVSLNWSALLGDVTYNIYWSSSSGESGVKYSIRGTNYVHTGLVNGRTYYYRVSAQDDAGESPLSSEEASIPREQDACYPLPSSGDWVINSDCTLYENYYAPDSVEVRNGAVLTIPDGVTLDIDLTNYNLTVREGSGVLIKKGGKIE
jgi:hypothetical protein